MKPDIHVPVPGPVAAKLVERDHRALMTTTKTAPIVAASGKGVWITDVDGNRFLDFTAGIGVVNAGYSHPKIVKAIQDQAAKLIHFAGTDYYYESQVELAERLGTIVPGHFAKKVFYTNSGTESNEAAIKVCKASQKGRQQFLAFNGAFHGRTMGSLAFTASKPVQKRGFFPTMGGVTHVPFPNPFRNAWNVDGYADPAELTNRALDWIETLFTTSLPPEDVAGIWIEPVQGEGGYIVPPKEFYGKLSKLMKAHGILVVADEVQTGFGRTGKMFAQEHFGIAADMTCLAKGIANGMPMGALVARADLDFDANGRHSNTYGGNVLATTSALATLDVIHEEKLVENSARVGAHLHKRLREIQEKRDQIGDVRGLGLMQAIEFVTDRRTRGIDTKLKDRVVDEATKRGLALLQCGRAGIRCIPPLCITEAEVDVGVEIIDASIAAALR